jgi:hypothetical protein
MRTCSQCKNEKDDGEFYQNPKTGKWKSWCRPCINLKSTEERAAKGAVTRKERVITSTHRTCTKCEELKTNDQFVFNDKTKSWHSWCRPCKTSTAKVQRVASGIEPKTFSVVTETEKSCNHCKEFKPHSEFYPSARGAGGLAAYCNSCSKEKYYDKEYSRNKVMEYRERNSDRYRAMHRLHMYNRRAKIKAVDDKTLTGEAVKFIMTISTCFWCKEEIPADKKTLEHIVELSNGGLHGVSNCTMSCFSCNSSRPNKSGEFDHLGNKGDINDD